MLAWELGAFSRFIAEEWGRMANRVTASANTLSAPLYTPTTVNASVTPLLAGVVSLIRRPTGSLEPKSSSPRRVEITTRGLDCLTSSGVKFRPDVNSPLIVAVPSSISTSCRYTAD